MIVFSKDDDWVDKLRRIAVPGAMALSVHRRLARVGEPHASEGRLVVLDREIAGAAPARIVQDMRALFPAAFVVIACADHELSSDAMPLMLSSGADDFVGKTWPDAKLLGRFRSLSERALLAAVRESRDGSLRLELRSHRALLGDKKNRVEIFLPAAEFALLWRLLGRQTEAVARAELLEVLRAAVGREVETEALSRRMRSLQRSLSAWKSGRLETVRGGYYRLAPVFSKTK